MVKMPLERGEREREREKKVWKSEREKKRKRGGQKTLCMQKEHIKAILNPSN